jgi:predicted nucleotidyltransferase
MTVTSNDIDRLAEEIARRFRPECIILFGSHAYGSPGPEADVDVLVVLPFEGTGRAMASSIRCAVQPGFSLDIIALTPDRLRERLGMEDFFLREIMARGKVLYEAPHA